MYDFFQSSQLRALLMLPDFHFAGDDVKAQDILVVFLSWLSWKMMNLECKPKLRYEFLLFPLITLCFIQLLPG